MKLGPLVLALLAAFFACPFGTAADEPKREPKPRFKGVEVYSWKDDKGTWQFAIMDGTNRNKTEKEVKTAPTVYAGTDKFTAALKLLAENEMVFWSHRIQGFEFPPKDDLKKIDGAAKAAKIQLERAEK
ncbi:hypothetical protein J8F10_18230 [Gemmata sp. G18]|uniref:Uncharacterized protein n=1 Tax=Gemmata palustris TaxID=2822762 RepID=A0ABS5BU39_9BACT|nr:hypothetical protein [Gemmata palustris]MBP3957203.1 hypothetical protein [Gemmata palustris]